MNKRQRKKQFKKRYGYNPPKHKANNITALIELVTTLRNSIADAVNKFMKPVSESIEKIKTMSEKEFQDKLDTAKKQGR